MKNKKFKKTLVFSSTYLWGKRQCFMTLLMIMSCSIGFAQLDVSGSVVDEDSNPLSGASIIEKGTANGVQADFDGNFAITVADQNATLVISYIGFLTSEIVVSSNTTISVILQEDLQKLDEVVVIGYGTTKRKNITGAVARVDLEDSPLGLSPNTNILQTLRGGTAGVNISSQNQVGGTPQIVLRGQNSINGSNTPLIVLDGVIFLGTIADINPNDIASIDVLKDASAAAAYGSRSANGVLMINSKKGRSDKPTIRYSTSAGFNVWQDKPNLMGTPTYLEKYAIQNNFATVNDIVWDDEYRTILFDQRVDTDWLDLISRTGFTQKHNVSVSGKSDKINYFFSGGYEDQEGVILGDDFRRISVRSRLTADVTDWLQVSLDGSYNNNDFSGVEANVNTALISAPIGYPYRYDGQPFDVASNTSRDLERYPTGSSLNSPLRGTDGTAQDIERSDFFRLAANLLFKVPGVEGLTYRLNYAINSTTGRDDFFEKESFHVGEALNQPFFDRYSPAALQTRLSQANGENKTTKNYNYVIDNIINYNKDFGKHSLDLTLVATRDFLSRRETTLIGSDFSDVGNTTLGINGLAFATNQINGLDIVERSNVGYLGRIGYAFDNKYHLNASYRRDGASVFGVDNRYGNFTSVGAAWTVTQEDFMQDNDILDYLKVNASYGVNGNQGVDPYETLPAVSAGASGDIEYAFGDAPSEVLFGLAQNTLANSTLGWERTTSFNAGFQSVWFNNKVALDVDVYFSETEDQIFTRQIPITTGFESITSSLGQVDNNGIEINLRTNNITTENVTWTSNLSFWRNRNEVVSLFGDDIDGDGREEDDIANNLFIGESLGAIYGFDFIGVVQEDDTQYIADTGAVPGDPMFRDIDGEPGISTDGDRTLLGFNKPNFNLSLSNTVTYKDFSFYMLLTGIFGGNDFYLSENPYATSFRTRFDTNELDHPWWTPENQSNTYLRPGYIGGQYLGLQSRGFVRIQDITFSYKVPQETLNKLNLGISSFELYATGNNIHTFTDWDGGGDPEYSQDGAEGITALNSGFGENTLPVPSTYSFGINVSF